MCDTKYYLLLVYRNYRNCLLYIDKKFSACQRLPTKKR
jgi:hypothetical protein